MYNASILILSSVRARLPRAGREFESQDRKWKLEIQRKVEGGMCDVPHVLASSEPYNVWFNPCQIL